MTKQKRRIDKSDAPVAVGYEADDIVVTLADGEILRNPLSWHPWLERATLEQRAKVEFDALSVFWPDLDEGLDIEGMRRGIPSIRLSEAEQHLSERLRAIQNDPKRRELLVDFVDLLTRAGEA